MHAYKKHEERNDFPDEEYWVSVADNDCSQPLVARSFSTIVMAYQKKRQNGSTRLSLATYW
ncbi:hypothetical protein [Neobacillus drentensis]|uniref:hypothetical protein n=1 Tax=Neobacillus drentensis TaxID=220684 RepID=UPI002FFD8CEE